MKWKVWKDDKIEDHDKGVGDGINQTEIMTFPCVYVWGEKLRGGCYRFRFQNLGGHFNLAIYRKVLQEIVQYADPVPELTVYQALFNKLKGGWNDSECLMKHKS